MSVKRSHEMVLVGYFLARCGRPTDSGSLPPAQLDTDQWNRAYAAFFGSLGSGRTLKTFSNSLKNARDLFDARVDSGRIGWRQTGNDREPLPLTAEAQRVLDRWASMSDGELWNTVSEYAEINATQVSTIVLKDSLAELGLAEEATVRTEGGRKAMISMRVERDPRLRDDAIRLHGESCSVCGFDFGEVFGEWGNGYIEVHHLKPLASFDPGYRKTNPATDLVVLCANCHRMVHRRRGTALTVDELSAKINKKAMRTWVASLAAEDETN